MPTNFVALPEMHRLMFLHAPYIFQLAMSYLYSPLNARLAEKPILGLSLLSPIFGSTVHVFQKVAI